MYNSALFTVITLETLTTAIPIRAVIAALLASLMFASMGAAVRFSSAYLPHEMTVFLRNCFGLLFLLPWIYRQGVSSLATRRLPAHILRSVSGLTAMYCFFYALANLQLAEAVLLNYSSPFFIAIIALIWLREKLPAKIMLAIAVGFTGICFILKPGVGMFQGAAWIGLLSAVFAAFAMVTIRNLSTTEPTLRIVFYFSLTGTIISAIPLLWAWEMPVLPALLAMAFAGLAASFGQLLLTYSYGNAPAALVGPYTYSTVVFAAFYGWLFWSETLDVYTVIGAILVIIAGSMTLQRKGLPRLTEPD